MVIKVVPLGAGQDVGRSCIIATLGGKTIMLDCGMHMGYRDAQRYPDFASIARSAGVGGGRPDFTRCIDAVIVTHFHLDHCGALPYFTERCGYDGPIYMTYPTKAVCPILLEDFRRIMLQRDGGDASLLFSEQDVKNCMAKVIGLNLHQTVQVAPDFEIRPYYAGHVLGAAMFWVRVGHESLVYTGDYNTTPDRHLGAAEIDVLEPDLLITESTYATTIRDSKRVREREFLEQVHQCVKGGGKVLIPVFALGRAQELCILLETYWERMRIEVPIYFSAGLVERANDYYRLFINWTNEKMKTTFAERNAFEFRHIKTFDRALLDHPSPMVLFASPGMLHAGTSLEVFKRWCGHPGNLVIIPGYCTVGTVGNKVLTATTEEVQLDPHTRVQVRCAVKQMSFSAHADARGILNMIRHCRPRHVMLVHGEKDKMAFLQKKIRMEMGLPCDYPPNGKLLEIRTPPRLTALISKTLLQSAQSQWSDDCLAEYLALPTSDDSNASAEGGLETEAAVSGEAPNRKRKAADPTTAEGSKRLLKYSLPPITAGMTSSVDAVVVLQKPEDLATGPSRSLPVAYDGKVVTLLSPAEARDLLHLKEHTIAYTAQRVYTRPPDSPAGSATLLTAIRTTLKAYLPFLDAELTKGGKEGTDKVPDKLTLRSVELTVRDISETQSELTSSWDYQDAELYAKVAEIVDDVLRLM